MSVIQISEFTKKVIQNIRLIPEGKVATYKQVAELSGKPQGSRGVAWVLHSCSTTYNLPWHRVLSAQGRISFDPRSDNFLLQLSRLKREGVDVSKDGSLSLEKFQWKKKPAKPRGMSKRPIPSMFSKSIVILSLLLFGAPTVKAAAQRNVEVDSESAPISPALLIDSAEVPPTSKSSHSWLASSATVMLASDYIYRGLSQTFGRPTAQGSLDFSHTTGLGFGFFASNINLGKDVTSPAQSEFDTYLDWNQEFKAIKVGAMILSSNYLGQTESDSVEFSGFVGSSVFKFDFAYMPKYFGVDSNSIYGRLTGTVPLQAKDTLIFAAGHTFFGEESKVGYLGYTDLKAGINHSVDGWGLELDWTGTDRKDLVHKALNDEAVVASMSHSFE